MRRIVAAAALAGMLAVGAVAQEPPAGDAGKAGSGGAPAARDAASPAAEPAHGAAADDAAAKGAAADDAATKGPGAAANDAGAKGSGAHSQDAAAKGASSDEGTSEVAGAEKGGASKTAAIGGTPAGAPAFEREPAFGRGEAGASGKGDARRADGEMPVTGFFVSAGLVLLALFGALTLLRKLGRNRGWTGSDAIQVLARKTLGPNQTLVLVEVGSRILQIGLAKDAMVALGEVTDPEEVARLKGKCATGRADSSTATFQKSLQESAADLAGGERAEDPPAAPALRDVKRELASIRTAVQGWASLARVRGREDGGEPHAEA